MVRTATKHDLPALLGLYRQLNPDDPILSPNAATAAWDRMAASGMTVLVAEAGDTVAATCTLAVIANLTRGGRPYALVENVVTDTAHRRHGLARAVLHAAFDHAWAAGCYKVMLLTGSKRPETLRFYEGVGLSQNKTGFQIRRPGGS